MSVTQKNKASFVKLPKVRVPHNTALLCARQIAAGANVRVLRFFYLSFQISPTLDLEHQESAQPIFGTCRFEPLRLLEASFPTL